MVYINRSLRRRPSYAQTSYRALCFQTLITSSVPKPAAPTINTSQTHCFTCLIVILWKLRGITHKHHLQNFILCILMNAMFKEFHYRFLHTKTCLSAVKQADVGGTVVCIICCSSTWELKRLGKRLRKMPRWHVDAFHIFTPCLLLFNCNIFFALTRRSLCLMRSRHGSG